MKNSKRWILTGVIVPIIIAIISIIQCNSKDSKTQKIGSISNENGSTTVAQGSENIITGNINAQDFVLGDVTIYQNISSTVANTTTKEAIQTLEDRLDSTEGKVELTREEIRLLTEALKDLDQRTSGIEKLPDGRTKFGSMISGQPSIIIEEYRLASTYYKKGDWVNSFKHAQNAISVFEETKKIKSPMSSGSLDKESVSKLYRLGALVAQELDKKEMAHEYAKKALKSENNSINKAILSTTLANLGKFDEAVTYIKEALNEDPQNQEYIDLQNQIQNR